jgi:hypothetical protein
MPCADNQDHHLQGLLPWHTTTHPRATTPHEPPTRSPSYTGSPAADQGRHTNSSRPPPRHKVQPPSLGHVGRADKSATQAAQHCHPSHDESQPYIIGPTPEMLPDAVASMHKHNSGPPPWHPPHRQQRNSSKPPHV